MKTTQEILQEIGSNISEGFGNNPLSDPIANRSNNIVKLVNAVSLGQHELYKRLEQFKFSSQASFIAGEALDYMGGKKGVTRKQGVKSQSILFVTGEDCGLMQSGTTLTDKQGREWTVKEDIELSANGSLIAFGVGVVEASSSGCWVLAKGELDFDNSNFPNIYHATNDTMMLVGGELENDTDYRNRILNTGALHQIEGTADSISAAVQEVDSVNFVRTHVGEICGEMGSMVVVHGGDDTAICEAIKRKGVLGGGLMGNTVCGADCFNEIRFQRPCPVKLCIEVQLNCDCPQLTPEDAESLIRSQSLNIALLQKVSSTNFSKLHNDIDNVRLSLKHQPLACGSSETIIDPFTNAPITWGTSEPYGICGGTVDCGVVEWKSSVSLNVYEYPIIDEITFVDCVPLTQECNTCV